MSIIYLFSECGKLEIGTHQLPELQGMGILNHEFRYEMPKFMAAFHRLSLVRNAMAMSEYYRLYHSPGVIALSHRFSEIPWVDIYLPKLQSIKTPPDHLSRSREVRTLPHRSSKRRCKLNRHQQQHQHKPLLL